MATTLDDIASLLREQNDPLRQLITLHPSTQQPPDEPCLSPQEARRIRKMAQSALAEALTRKAQKRQEKEKHEK